MIKNQYENLKVIHGFKVFKSDWKCRDKQYSCPGKFEEEGELSVCGHGMHFCENVADCFSYYDFDSNINKPSDWTYNDWLRSEARCILSNIPKNIVKWIYSKDMTDEEKAEHPTHETTGGYLKVLDESECAQVWWNDLTDYDKNIIKSIPNFDADIFEQCTGIRI